MMSNQCPVHAPCDGLIYPLFGCKHDHQQSLSMDTECCPRSTMIHQEGFDYQLFCYERGLSGHGLSGHGWTWQDTYCILRQMKNPITNRKIRSKHRMRSYPADIVLGAIAKKTIRVCNSEPTLLGETQSILNWGASSGESIFCRSSGKF